MTCLRGKFLLAGACNSLTNRCSSDIADNCSARCTSRIIFSSSFNITCTISCMATLFLSILFGRSFKSWTLCCTYRSFAVLAYDRLIEFCATLHQSQLRKVRYAKSVINFWAIHTTDSAICFLLQASPHLLIGIAISTEQRVSNEVNL